MSISSLIWKMKVTYMPIAFFICSLFNVHAFFFSSNAHSHPNGGLKWMLISSWKKWSEFHKCSFWSLFSKMKITCMSIAWFIFWVFTVMPSFSVLTLWHTFAHCYPNSSSKRVHYRLKMVIFCLKMYFWTLISNMKVTCFQIACFILFFASAFFFGSQLVKHVFRFPS